MARDKRYGWRLVAAASALALVATACGGGDDPGDDPVDEQPGTDDPEPGDDQADGDDYCADGSTDTNLVWVHEQEPPDLHFNDPANNLSVTSWIVQSMLEGLYGISSTIEYVPELLAEPAELEELDGGGVRVSYQLRDDIQWSDGTPITSADVRNTFDIIMEGYDREEGTGGTYLMSSREGYRLVDADTWEETSDTEFSFEMDSFFAGYPGMLDFIMPAHVISDAAAANAAWGDFTVDGEPVPTSGPMVMGAWSRGVSVELERNDNYHGGHPDNDDIVNKGVACVPGITVNFVADTDAQINAMRAGEADILMAQPQTQFADQISEDDRFTAASTVGPVFEQLSLNLVNEHLSDPLVREALAYAVDKSDIMARLYTPLYGDALDPNGLGNSYWLTGEFYVNHQAEYDGPQIDQAQAKLEEAGYTENASGFYEHPERGQLDLRISTTGGNALRELQQQIIAEQVAEAGFNITINNLPGTDFFDNMVFSNESIACTLAGGEDGAEVEGITDEPVTSECFGWDIAMFAWVGGPWPGSQSVAYRTGSGNNPHRYSNEDWDALSAQCDVTIDDQERGECYNELDRYVTTLEIDAEDGLMIIPLTSKPSYYAYSNERLERAALAPDANYAGPIVYAVDFLPRS